MNSFFERLIKKTKQEPYPAEELDQLWNEIVFNSSKVDVRTIKKRTSSS